MSLAVSGFPTQPPLGLPKEAGSLEAVEKQPRRSLTVRSGHAPPPPGHMDGPETAIEFRLLPAVFDGVLKSRLALASYTKNLALNRKVKIKG